MCILNLFHKKDIKIPVLNYHVFVNELSTDGTQNPDYTTTGQRFDEQLSTLKREGYVSISMTQLYEAVNQNKRLPHKPFLVTFDDGTMGEYEIAFPILQKYEVFATIFVVTDQVSGYIEGNRCFSWDNAKTMENSGLVLIGSHGKRHVAYNMEPVGVLKSDIIHSFDEIKSHLGHERINAFAYPFGLHSSDTIKTLKSVGVDVQATGLNMNYRNSIDLSNLMRINMAYDVTGEQIINK